MRKRFIAEWYEEDAVQGSEFIIDRISTSSHETLDEAKTAAFKNASRHDVMGWAGVVELAARNDDDEDKQYYNEVYRGQWQGWVCNG